MAEIKIDENTTFEAALEELEKLIGEMEAGSLPLEALVARLERGNALNAFCRNKLTQLEGRIEKLTKDNGEGGEWEEFDSSSAPGGPRVRT